MTNRRRIRIDASRLAIWLAAGLLLSVGRPALLTAQDWPQFLGPTHDGQAAATDRTLDWTKKPEFVWELPVGDGYGLGSVSGDLYLQMDAAAAPQGDGILERIRCVDLATGAVRWEQSQPVDYRDLYGYEAGPRSTPAVADDQIFSYGVAGDLVCRDLADGSMRWHVDTSQRYGVVQNFFGVGSSPLVWRDRVIVMVGGSPESDSRIAPGRLDRVSPNGTALVAFSRDSGEELWRSGDDLASYSTPRPMEIDGQTIVLLFARGGLIAVDPETGEMLWRYDHRADSLESVNAMVPLVSADRVFVSECYDVGSVLLTVSRRGAEPVWIDPPGNRRQQAMRVHWSTPILLDGHLYGCSGRNAPDSDFRCVELATGKVKWSDDRRRRASVTCAGDRLVVLEERGQLQILRPTPKQMEVVASWDLSRPDGERPAIEYPSWSAPIVVGDRLLVRGDTRVICLKIPSP